MRLRLTSLLASLALALTTTANAGLVALSTFGNGDGWRAPNEIVVGDSAGTATGSNYNYLQSGNLERGLAYNPASGNLILVSRNAAGNAIRILNGATGADQGPLSLGPPGSPVVTGGTFAQNMAGVSDSGDIFVANLQGNVGTAAFKLYRWSSEAQVTPDVVYNATITGFAASPAPRLGDSLDVIGSGSSTRVAGGMSGVIGVTVFDNIGVGTTTATAVPAIAAPNANITAGDFRLGITFGATSTDLIGKQTSQNLEIISAASGTWTGVATIPTLDNGTGATLRSNGEAPMDFAVIDGNPYLATIDVNASLVRVYSLASGAPILMDSLTTTSGTLAGNLNATGQVKWGAIGAGTATLYAMSTNQGIQAFTFTVPEPASAASAVVGLACLGLRRRR